MSKLTLKLGRTFLKAFTKKTSKKAVVNVRLKEGHSCKWNVNDTIPSLNIAAHPILVAYPCPEWCQKGQQSFSKGWHFQRVGQKKQNSHLGHSRSSIFQLKITCKQIFFGHSFHSQMDRQGWVILLAHFIVFFDHCFG